MLPKCLSVQLASMCIHVSLKCFEACRSRPQFLPGIPADSCQLSSAASLAQGLEFVVGRFKQTGCQGIPPEVLREAARVSCGSLAIWFKAAIVSHVAMRPIFGDVGHYHGFLHRLDVPSSGLILVAASISDAHTDGTCTSQKPRG